ncbi:2-dehydro-3-deoxy-6-phosphogalactonate aldolase [Halomonas shantousis]
MNDTRRAALEAAMQELPLVAILRGIHPQEIEEVFDALVEAEFRMIEVPLNSPFAWQSLEKIAKRCPDDVVFGAGTVLTTEDVRRLAELEAPLMVTPNTDPEVIRAGVEHGLAPLVGCMTPSEAFAAAKAGARGLKLFPAARMGCGYYKDLRAVLPADLPVLAVGGVNKDNMSEWHSVGIGGFGFGSNLYMPGHASAEIGGIARELVAEWRRLQELATLSTHFEHEGDQ